MNKVLTNILCISVLGLAACDNAGKTRPTDKAGIEAWPRIESPVSNTDSEKEKIEALLARMTLEEKVGQIMQAEIQEITPEEVKRYHIGSVLNGGGSQPYRIKNAKPADWIRLADEFYATSMAPEGGVPIPVIWGTDAMHGHGNVIGATLFPHNIGLGAANNPELVRLIGEVTAREVRATGIPWVFGPTVAVAQDDRWGRTYESYSEDPLIVKKLARALVEGLQGRAGTAEFLDENHVVATAKHFIADGGTFEGDDQGDARISERELIDIHAPGYVSALEAGVQTVMASFSSWNGQKIHGSQYLLTDVLKEQMGFEGLVVSDWNAHGQVPGCTNENCPAAINAGIDLVMVTSDWKALIENTLKQVRAGDISIERIDDAVRRILTVKLHAGLFENNPAQNIHAKSGDIIGNPQHRELARQAVRESLVLLKNKNNILPLNPAKTYLVAGDGADNIGKQAGGWSINWQGSLDNTDFPDATSIYEGIRQTVVAAGGRAVLSVDGIYKDKPDAAIVVFGENPYAEGHGDLITLEFEPRNKNSLALLKKFSGHGIPTVALFISGRPLWVNPEINAADAFVAVWLPGSEGAGVADVIFANADGAPRFDFTGRLSFSWPKTPLQNQLNPHHPGYDPLFPLEYGLNYASGKSGPGELPVDVDGVDSGALKDIPLYAGRPLAPWVVIIKNHERGQTLSGAFAALPKGDVAVRTSDKDVQEDALTFRWQDAKSASLSIEEGKFLDLSAFVKNGALSFDLKINTPPTGDLALVIRCGPDCERRLRLNETAHAFVNKGWQNIVIPLACIARETDTFERVTTPFMLETSGEGEVSLANIVFRQSAGETKDCPK